MRLRTTTVALAAGLMASACIVVPRTEAGYDPECRISTHRMVLDTVQLRGVNDCNHRPDCIAVAAGLVVTAASAVVSGSIAVVGNIVYWGEQRAGCMLTSPAPQPAAPVVQPGTTAPA